MPRDLRRYQESGQSHFVTFSCYHRQPFFDHPTRFQLFVLCLEEMRRRFELCVYAYVVMPEHVHLLLSEPEAGILAEAVHFLKLSFTKRSRYLPMGESGSFWQKRYYDRNVRDHHEFMEKLGYIHRNPVKRGLVASPEQWKWSSYRHYALRETDVVEIESEWTARDREKRLVGGRVAHMSAKSVPSPLIRWQKKQTGCPISRVLCEKWAAARSAVKAS